MVVQGNDIMNKKEKENLRKGKILFEQICKRFWEIDITINPYKDDVLDPEFYDEYWMLNDIMRKVTDKRSGWYLYNGELILLIKSSQHEYNEWDVLLEYVSIKDLQELKKEYPHKNYEVEQVTIQHENWFKELKKVDVEIKIKK